MKVLILTPEVHFHSPVILRDLLERFKGTDIKFNVILTPKVSADRKSSASLSKIIKNSGIKYLISMILLKIKFDLYRLIEKVTSRPVSVRKYLAPAEVCEAYDVEYTVTENINSEEMLEYVKNISPDITLSVFFNQILRKEMLSKSKKCLNVHPSFLPDYKGMSPILWMLSEGADKGGATIHEMTEKLDSGNIISQKEFDIDSSDSFFSVYRKASLAASGMLIGLLASDDIQGKGIPQSGEAKIYGPVTREAIDKVFKKYSFLRF